MQQSSRYLGWKILLNLLKTIRIYDILAESHSYISAPHSVRTEVLQREAKQAGTSRFSPVNGVGDKDFSCHSISDGGDISEVVSREHSQKTLKKTKASHLFVFNPRAACRGSNTYLKKTFTDTGSHHSTDRILAVSKCLSISFVELLSHELMGKWMHRKGLLLNMT